MNTSREYYVPYKKDKLYFKVIGKKNKNNKTPLLILNGGPGSPHNYLLDISFIAEHGREVIFYDPLGCGLSKADDKEFDWSIDLFLDQIIAVRQALSLSRVNLLGHSWGGMLAIEYLLTNPSGVDSVVMSSTMVSMPLFNQEMTRLRRRLPLSTQLTLRRYERNNDVDNPSYKEAYQVFSKEHIFRQENWPAHLTPPADSFGTAAYRKMWGLSECYPNGTLKKWDRITDLNKISVPTLITSGKFDELTPKQAMVTKENIPNSEQVLFEYSAHMAHIEETDRYVNTVKAFLDSISIS